ncbi:MAG: dihydroorotase [Candidatus Latescibacteria bacterium]|nr:dihydroorotase [Candidatus Latescibacterota bacterium]
MPEILAESSDLVCITGGRILDPDSNRDEIADLWIENGLILNGRPEQRHEKQAVVVDATGKIVAPGLIDARVYLREPGFEYRETVESGTLAAGSGGFTSVLCMPDTNPVMDKAEVVRYVNGKAETAHTRVFPVGAATENCDGRNLAEIGDMVDAGVVAVTDPNRTVSDARLMRTVLEYAGMLSIPVICHCEDSDLSAEGLMNESYSSTRLGLAGNPNVAEDIILARDIMLAELTECPIHIAHLSTAGAVALVRDAKARGVRVSAEVSPYHCVLTDEALDGYNTSLKLSPPLRSGDDVLAIREGLRDGTIDAIVSDHAPYAVDEKTVEFAAAPSGSIGTETVLSLVMTELLDSGVISMNQVLRLLSLNPARIFGLSGGTLQPGAPADITLIDSDASWTVSGEAGYSKSRSTAIQDRKLRGRADTTVLGGQVLQWRAGS